MAKHREQQGQNKKIEAIKIKLTDAPAGVGITYQSYVNGYEWQEYVSNGEKKPEQRGQNRKLEAIKIKLTGTDEYSVEYRTHVQDQGWTKWVKDGEISGIIGKNLKVEAK